MTMAAASCSITGVVQADLGQDFDVSEYGQEGNE